MATKPIGGITGVLGELISPSATPAGSPRPEQRSPKGRQPDPVDVREPQAITSPQRARVGRPLARSLQRAGRKEKVTFRINSDLIAQEARCQLGELVEQALTTYRESRRNRR